MSVLEAAQSAADRLRAAPADVTIDLAASADADGVTAAAVLAKALLRASHRFHVTFESGAQTLRILVPPGAATTSRASPFELRPSRPGQPLPMVAFGVALALAEGNRDLAPVALASRFLRAPGGTPATDGFEDDAVQRGILRLETRPRLPELPLLDVVAFPAPPLARRPAPDYPAAHAFLQRTGLPAEATPSELDPESRVRLVSLLALAQLRAGAAAGTVPALYGPTPISSAFEGAPLPRGAVLVDAAAREGEPGLALAWLLGDPSPRDELDGLLKRYHGRVRRAFTDLGPRPASPRADLLVFDGGAPAYLDLLAHLVAERLDSAPRAIVATATEGDVSMAYAVAPPPVARGSSLATLVHDAAVAVGGSSEPVGDDARASVSREALPRFLDALGRRLLLGAAA